MRSTKMSGGLYQSKLTREAWSPIDPMIPEPLTVIDGPDGTLREGKNAAGWG